MKVLAYRLDYKEDLRLGGTESEWYCPACWQKLEDPEAGTAHLVVTLVTAPDDLPGDDEKWGTPRYCDACNCVLSEAQPIDPWAALAQAEARVKALTTVAVRAREFLDYMGGFDAVDAMSVGEVWSLTSRMRDALAALDGQEDGENA